MKTGKIVINPDEKVAKDDNDIIIKSTADDTKANLDDTNVDDTNVDDTNVDTNTDDTNTDDTTVKVDDVEYKLNDKGDALNEDGSVFKTKEELDALQDTSDDTTDDNTIEIQDEDGKVVTYSINENGDAVDDKGNVMYTADELKKLDEDGSTDGVGIKDIIETTNIPIYDNEGNLIEYEDSPKGISQYVQDVYERGQHDGIVNNNEALFGKHPILQNVINHLELGGSLEDFKEQEDYSGVKLDKKDEAQLRKFAVEAYVAQGMSIDKANKYFDYVKSTDTDNDEVYKEAKAGLEYLKEVQQEKVQEQQNQLQQQRIEEIEQVNNYWGITVNDKGQLVDLGVKDSVYDIVKNKTIKIGDDTYKIPDRIRVEEDGKPVMRTANDFLKYMYEPVVVTLPDGRRVQTTRDNLRIQKEDSKRTINNDVFEAFRRFVGYDDTQLINEKVKEREVKKVKRLVVKNKKGVVNRTAGKKKIVINTNKK